MGVTYTRKKTEYPLNNTIHSLPWSYSIAIVPNYYQWATYNHPGRTLAIISDKIREVADGLTRPTVLDLHTPEYHGVT